MIEDLAIQYVGQSENNSRLIDYGITISGAVIAGLSHKSKAELHRGPYFACLCALVLATVIAEFIWFGSIPAMSGGFVWVLMLVDVVVGLCFGYAHGVIAMARSRNAYGHGKMAFLAFIPLANFWLLLRPPKRELSTSRVLTIPLVSGRLGVMAGFVFLFAGIGLAVFIRLELERMFADAENDPSRYGASLEAILRQMAAEVPSQRVDEVTTLLRVEGDGTTLRYLYEVSTDADALSTSMNTEIVQRYCTQEVLRPVIEAGATIEHVYRHIDGFEVGTVTMTSEVCGFR